MISEKPQSSKGVTYVNCLLTLAKKNLQGNCCHLLEEAWQTGVSTYARGAARDPWPRLCQFVLAACCPRDSEPAVDFCRPLALIGKVAELLISWGNCSIDQPQIVIDPVCSCHMFVIMPNWMILLNAKKYQLHPPLCKRPVHLGDPYIWQKICDKKQLFCHEADLWFIFVINNYYIKLASPIAQILPDDYNITWAEGWWSLRTTNLYENGRSLLKMNKKRP